MCPPTGLESRKGHRLRSVLVYALWIARCLVLLLRALDLGFVLGHAQDGLDSFELQLGVLALAVALVADFALVLGPRPVG